MLICELLPLRTTRKIVSLTYFTALKVEIGDLVEINMNGQILQSIVVSVSDIRDSKQEIRSKDFKIKKIIKIITKNYIDKNLLSEIYNISTLLATTINNIFNTLAPVDLLSKINFSKRKSEDINRNSNNKFYIFPTNLELRKFKKNNLDLKNNCSTPSFQFLIHENVKEIVICNESSKYYYSNFKNLDTKKALTYVCNLLNIKISYEYLLPSLELYSNSPLPLENGSNVDVEIIKMSKEIYLDDKVSEIILKNLKANLSSKILLYTTRLGSYTQSVCNDCGEVVKCKKCDRPYVLYEEIDGNYYRCNSCKDKIRIITEIKCATCNGMNIKTLGIGSDGLERYIKELIEKNTNLSPIEVENKIFRIDSTNTNTPPKVENILNQFTVSIGTSIMIATEQLIPALEKNNFDYVFIISIDSLFYLNDYNIDERIFFTVNRLKSATKILPEKNFYLQTRMSEKFIKNNINRITDQNLKDFYVEELAKRKKNYLPPYTYIITYEANSNLLVPKFLENFKRLVVPITYNTSRFIFFIEKEVWEKEKTLRRLVTENFYQFNLKINSKEIF